MREIIAHIINENKIKKTIVHNVICALLSILAIEIARNILDGNILDSKRANWKLRLIAYVYTYTHTHTHTYHTHPVSNIPVVFIF